MDDKTQDSKKTVVAFIAGLIIGGLLVWLFSGPSEGTSSSKTGLNTKKDADTEIDENLGDIVDETKDTGGITDKTTQGNEAFSVADQSAGMMVSLGTTVQYPSKEGWIVVHEDVNGELGSALGAARYNTEVGLTPTSVELLRGTMSGKTYHVVYYTEDGDRMFDLKMDMPMMKDDGGVLQATFVAE